MQNVRRDTNHLEILRSRKLRALSRRLCAEAHSLAQSARLTYFLAVKHYDSLVDTPATIQRKVRGGDHCGGQGVGSHEPDTLELTGLYLALKNLAKYFETHYLAPAALPFSS